MTRSFAGSALRLVRVAGAALAVWGVAYVINGATQAGAYVGIRVATDGPPPLPSGVVLDEGEFGLNVWGATVGEQVLSRADVLLGGLCAGLAALVLSVTVKGRPFTRRDSAGLGALAVVSSLGSLLPGAAAAAVLDRAGLTEHFVPSSTLSWMPIAGAGLLLGMALAFRTRDADAVPRSGSPVPLRSW
ncbi:hypothetical protein OUY22_01930 [Nonomuraea sp. MCN248]|uniref:DUF2567 domain-containing protein n=1 Tax=Nonomuraea corallina TaxID=2989783 RepID=A0ABT4S4N6_9ACTN|nr:hypothetical protein [Nonomuraea corallina]MDA0632159.1 hypothetical protein [Nonomuraea corallina]